MSISNISKKHSLDINKTLGKEALTSQQLISRFGTDIIKTKEFKEALANGSIQKWNIFTKEPIFYKRGFLSERHVLETVEENIKNMSFDNQVLESIRKSDGFEDLYKFLSAFDPWINELILAQTVNYLLETGKLEDILTRPEKIVIATSKLGPLTEDDILAYKAYQIHNLDTGELYNSPRIRLLDWHLITQVNSNPIMYQTAYCTRLAYELERLDISLSDLLDSGNLTNDKAKTLIRLGLLNKKASTHQLSPLGQQQVEFMSKCRVGFSEDALENASALFKHWYEKTVETFIAYEAEFLQGETPHTNAFEFLQENSRELKDLRAMNQKTAQNVIDFSIITLNKYMDLEKYISDDIIDITSILFSTDDGSFYATLEYESLNQLERILHTDLASATDYESKKILDLRGSNFTEDQKKHIASQEYNAKSQTWQKLSAKWNIYRQHKLAQIKRASDLCGALGLGTLEDLHKRLLYIKGSISTCYSSFITKDIDRDTFEHYTILCGDNIEKISTNLLGGTFADTLKRIMNIKYEIDKNNGKIHYRSDYDIKEKPYELCNNAEFSSFQSLSRL